MAQMQDGRSPPLCRLCRNLNLRIETFLDLAHRYPTSLEYSTIEDSMPLEAHCIARHYVPGERIDEATDYTDNDLNQKLPSGIASNERPKKEKVLGTLAAVIARASSCALCALVTNVARTVPSSFDSDVKCGLNFHYVAHGYLKMVPSLYKSDGDTKYGRYRCCLIIGNYTTILHPVHTREDLSWFGGRLYGDRVDFGLCKRWLHACETSHRRCDPQNWQRHMKAISRLRLIDVQEMCLVDAVGGERYVALSYVWGSVSMFQTSRSSMEGLYQSGGLQKFWQELSTTIQDATYAVRGLEERYLWTDAICIVQDDPADKVELVKDMHMVYAGAVLTLVAAEGVDANAGLPGVRSNSRGHSESWHVGNDLTLLPSHSDGEILPTYPWAQRAWTFQEGMLSPRTLLFTNRTVSFTCCSTTWVEDVKNPNEDEEPPWTFAPGISFDFRSFLPEVQAQLSGQTSANTQGVEEQKTDLLLDLWTELVDNISSRNLSFESDILFDAAGMISVIQTMFNVNTIYGLPERRLEQFLFWSPREPGRLRRRRDMNGNALHPTWSWAGWVGQISWAEHTAMPFGDEIQEIEWLGASNTASEPVRLRCYGRGIVNDDIALTTDSHNDVRHVKTLDLPILMVNTRTAALCISTTVGPPSWVSELQFSAWIFTENCGQKGSGVYCVASPHGASHVVGSVVLDSAEAMFESENAVTTFAIISSFIYQERQHAEPAALKFHRVLALRQKEGMFERIGHGAVLVEEVSGIAWQNEVLLLV